MGGMAGGHLDDSPAQLKPANQSPQQESSPPAAKRPHLGNPCCAAVRHFVICREISTSSPFWLLITPTSARYFQSTQSSRTSQFYNIALLLSWNSIMVCAKCQKLTKGTTLATPGVKKKSEIYHGSAAASSSKSAVQGPAGIGKVRCCDVSCRWLTKMLICAVLCRASCCQRMQRTLMPSTLGE